MDKEKEYEPIRFNDIRFPIFFQLYKSVTPRESLSLNLWHEQIEIKYYLKGDAEIICDSNIYIAQKGDVVVINPCERHSTKVYAYSPLYHLLNIDPKLLYSNLPDLIDSKYIEPIFSGKLKFRNLIRGNRAVSAIVKKIFQELEHELPGYEIQVKALIFSLIAQLLREECEKSESAYSPKEIAQYNNRLEPAFRYIHERYQEQIRLEDLAQLCHISVKYYCKLFKQLTGVSCVTYINELRINKACILLSSADLTVAETAERCGFSDEGYFSRCFRAQKGLSPQAYRRKLSK